MKNADKILSLLKRSVKDFNMGIELFETICETDPNQLRSLISLSDPWGDNRLVGLAKKGSSEYMIFQLVSSLLKKGETSNLSELSKIRRIPLDAVFEHNEEIFSDAFAQVSNLHLDARLGRCDVTALRREPFPVPIARLSIPRPALRKMPKILEKWTINELDVYVDNQAYRIDMAKLEVKTDAFWTQLIEASRTLTRDISTWFKFVDAYSVDVLSLEVDFSPLLWTKYQKPRENRFSWTIEAVPERSLSDFLRTFPKLLHLDLGRCAWSPDWTDLDLGSAHPIESIVWTESSFRTTVSQHMKFHSISDDAKCLRERLHSIAVWKLDQDLSGCVNLTTVELSNFWLHRMPKFSWLPSSAVITQCNTIQSATDNITTSVYEYMADEGYYWAYTYLPFLDRDGRICSELELRLLMGLGFPNGANRVGNFVTVLLYLLIHPMGENFDYRSFVESYFQTTGSYAFGTTMHRLSRNRLLSVAREYGTMDRLYEMADWGVEGARVLCDRMSTESSSEKPVEQPIESTSQWFYAVYSGKKTIQEYKAYCASHPEHKQDGFQIRRSPDTRLIATVLQFWEAGVLVEPYFGGLEHWHNSIVEDVSVCRYLKVLLSKKSIDMQQQCNALINRLLSKWIQEGALYPKDIEACLAIFKTFNITRCVTSLPMAVEHRHMIHQAYDAGLTIVLRKRDVQGWLSYYLAHPDIEAYLKESVFTTSMKQCVLDGVSGVDLQKAICLLPDGLTRITLENCQVGPEAIDWTRFTALRRLRLVNVHVHPECDWNAVVTALPSTLTSLTVKQCDWNAVPETLQQLIHLERLLLPGNPLTTVPEWIATSSIKVLGLSYTNVVALPPAIQCSSVPPSHVDFGSGEIQVYTKGVHIPA